MLLALLVVLYVVFCLHAILQDRRQTRCIERVEQQVGEGLAAWRESRERVARDAHATLRAIREREGADYVDDSYFEEHPEAGKRDQR